MATTDRYFMVVWETNTGRRGDIALDCDGFLNRDELVETISELFGRSENEEFQITYVYEFDSKEDYEQWIKEDE